jgi:hypothetical protein
MSVKVTVVRRAAPGGVHCVKIESHGARGSWYLIRQVSCEIGGKAWVVLRLGAAEPYHVRIAAPEGDQCDCLGFLSHGKCRHVSATRALIALEDGTCSVVLNAGD